MWYLNRKDGIKETSRLKGRDFKILDKGFDSKGVYIIEARHPSTGQLLGFISWDKSLCSLFLEATAEQTNIDRFSCGHIIKNLYDLILVELSKGSSMQENRSSDAEHLRQMAREKIDQMLCMVEVIQGNSAGVPEVSWVHAESERISKLHHLDLKGRITMHCESTCAGKKSELLASGM